MRKIMNFKNIPVTASTVALLTTASATATNLLVDASFEQQAVLQNLPSHLVNGQIWGAGWTNINPSSWQPIQAGGAWTGGVIARTEEYAAGWKWAKDGGVFAVIKDRGTMSQTFVATEDSIGKLTWFDANRPSWKTDTWYGRPNDYSVTVTDSLSNIQTVGQYTSQVFGGLESNSWINAGDDRFSLSGKQGWDSRTGNDIVLKAGQTYTLSFNSLSPYWSDANGQHVDDRTTLLDNISLVATPTPVPESGSTLILLGLTLTGIAGFRRKFVA